MFQGDAFDGAKLRGAVQTVEGEHVPRLHPGIALPRKAAGQVGTAQDTTIVGEHQRIRRFQLAIHQHLCLLRHPRTLHALGLGQPGGGNLVAVHLHRPFVHLLYLLFHRVLDLLPLDLFVLGHLLGLPHLAGGKGELVGRLPLHRARVHGQIDVESIVEALGGALALDAAVKLGHLHLLPHPTGGRQPIVRLVRLQRPDVPLSGTDHAAAVLLIDVPLGRGLAVAEGWDTGVHIHRPKLPAAHRRQVHVGQRHDRCHQAPSVPLLYQQGALDGAGTDEGGHGLSVPQSDTGAGDVLLQLPIQPPCRRSGGDAQRFRRTLPIQGAGGVLPLDGQHMVLLGRLFGQIEVPGLRPVSGVPGIIPDT